MIKKVLSTIIAGMLVGMVVASAGFAYDFESYSAPASAQVSVSAFGTDTIAGFSTSLESSNVGTNISVVFKVEKPDGSYSEFPATSGLDGIARVKLADFHTRVAGTYKVSAKSLNSSQYGSSNTFNVLPGEISETYSEITPTEQVVRIGRDIGEVEVTLKDIFGNSISNHMVELISSRGEDDVNTDVNLSDSQGKVVFSVNSPESGVSSYTIYDLTSNKILSERAKVVYFTSSESLFSSTEAFLGNAVGNASGPVAYLKFDNLPASANTNQSLSFTLSARDESDQTVTDYLGTVHFSVISGSTTGVTLPSDYTYTAQNLGTHPFALALSFTSPGSYVIEAKDVSDPMVFGTSNVTVTSAQSGVDKTVTVTNPTPGTYSNNVQVISGTTTPASSLVIYDSNVKIGNAVASQTGAFAFTTGFLTDGDHEFYVAIVNEGGTILASSSKIKVTIDTTSPGIDKVEMVPSGTVPSGGDVEIKVYTELGLTQLLLDVNGSVYEMKGAEGGYYSAKFKAPILGGSYPMKFTLVDALGNEAKIEEASYVLNVGVGGSGSGTSVANVAGLVAVPGNHKITLSWTSPKTGAPVQFYRIYYGLSANQLAYVIDTWNASTTWYVPDLQNGKEYFFAVAAVSNSGSTSALMSNIVSAIPSDVYPDGVGQGGSTGVWQGTAGSEQLGDMKEDASQSGPEVVWLFVSAILGGLFYSYFSMKKKEEGFRNL